MMGFGFVSPWILAGLLTGAIPIILHLTSSARAKEVYFPTLRLVRMSMEKTAHRRRLKHWLLLVLRACALIFLSIGLAQPISKAFANFQNNPYSAVIILDDSFSMNANRPAQSRFEFTAQQALKLLDGDTPPSTIGVMLTSNPSKMLPLSSDLSQVRKALKDYSAKARGANLGDCVNRAADILNSPDTLANKVIFVFSDLQKVSLNENFLVSPDPQANGDISVIVVNTHSEIQNTGVTSVRVKGNPTVNSPVTVSCELINSSPHPRQVTAALQFLPDQPILKQVIRMGKAGSESSRTKVLFSTHTPAMPGQLAGQVVILEDDDLKQDNASRFCMELADNIQTLIITGQKDMTGSTRNPAATLEAALTPFSDQPTTPWPISTRAINILDFTPDDLENIQAVYVADVGEFSQTQADAIRQFANNGGSVMIFLGPSTNPQNYNTMLDRDLLGATIGSPVGIVGPDAPGRVVTQVDISDPYLVGLYDQPEQYYAPLVQRYFKLERDGVSGVLMRLDNSAPLVLTQKVSSGKVTLCATTISSQWSNLSGSAAKVVVPMIIRCAMLAKQAQSAKGSYQGGEAVTLEPQAVVTDPTGKKHQADKTGVFKNTAQVGWYECASPDGSSAKRIAVNPPDSQLDLQSLAAPEAQKIFTDTGWEKTFIADDLKSGLQMAAQASKPRNYWDIALLIVLGLLLGEAFIANLSSPRSISQPS